MGWKMTRGKLARGRVPRWARRTPAPSPRGVLRLRPRSRGV